MKVRVTEKSIQSGIIAMLSANKWRVKRVPPSIYSAKGWCDLIAIKDGQVLFIECKGPKGKLSIDQAEFGRQISEAGGVYIVARNVEYVKHVINEIGERGKENE